MECIIFTGIQASGKSTFYKEIYFRTHVRISMDMLKTRNRESKLLEFCLETGQSFVVDNTNPEVSDRKRYIVRAKERKFKIVGYYFQSGISECKRRNSLRDDCEIVPDIGISGTYNKMKIPVMDEGHDELYYVSIENNEFKVLDHVELGKKLSILDFERATKISGSGFPLYTGKGATLERALINFMLDYHLHNHGYSEMMPPILVNRESMKGTGQIPKMEEDMYFVEKDDLFPIPTAEVPITNIHRDEILAEKDLTIKYVGYTPCFRREAGSYGKESKGFLRVHQFNKVEMVKFSKPENSYDELELMVKDAEDILQALKIPYRILMLCTGDLSFSAAKCYDIETWSPAENKWLEASSCSNFEAFQARRANIRFRREDAKKPEFIHTLNGSGLATSRLMVSLLENYQTPEGKVIVPKVLQKYTGFEVIG